jgi:hypothetical protein
MDTKEILEVIEKLNIELFEKTGEDELDFSYMTNGFFEVIKFNNYVLWSSENDTRQWLERNETNLKSGYEPLEPFLRREFNKYFEKLSKLKL